MSPVCTEEAHTLAQAPHETSVSLQEWLHTPHDSGQLSIINFCWSRGDGQVAQAENSLASTTSMPLPALPSHH
eukprot:scaffold67379_cov33-Tisochrysis_lutea.AAC.1